MVVLFLLQEDEEGKEGKEKQGPEEHLASVSQMRMIGPAFLVVGFLMVGLGITLFVLARKVRKCTCVVCCPFICVLISSLFCCVHVFLREI